jgi:phospholipid/cholesterol/gamma-HCH transport system permease protein
LAAWDSTLLAFLVRCARLCEARGIALRRDSLPPGLQQLLSLATATPEAKDARRQETEAPLLQRIGEDAVERMVWTTSVLTFIGDCALAFGRLARRRARVRRADVLLLMQQCGAEALPIVALINLLVGMIISFVGAVQLSHFGAAIYVADLVGISTVREMGCLMTAIIMCGRTGAAFAAQLGTMKVNEEIDALRTFGVAPVEFLVLPRVIALFLMMPLLCVFADVMGILGGFVVAILMLDLSAVEFWRETVAAITLTNFLIGVIKGAVFGALIAHTGCLRGMQCGSNAAAVGRATTSAVVSGITAIIVADAVAAVLCNALRI